jgi:PIN domain nuclease of toxin-antitoxin system
MILLDTHIWVNWILLGRNALKPTIASAIECLPITCSITQRSVNLTDIHRDPADRMIIATALEYGAQLASYDTAFPNYPELSGYLLTGQ